MRFAIATAAVASALALPAAADAAFVEAPTIWDRTAAVYTAGAGELNDVTIEFDGQRYAITDSGARIEAGEGCEVVDPPQAHRATCDGGSVPWARLIEVHLNDGDDTFGATLSRASDAPTVSVTGGGGRDRLYVAANRAVLHGGADDDRVTGRGVSGDASGGDGSDHVEGDYVQGSILGGADDDTIVTLERSPPADPNDVPSAGQAARGGDGADRIEGHGARDSLYGDDGNDVVIGGPGNDGVSGGPGDDTLYGGEGSDALYGEDGTDTLDGGGGDGVSRSVTGYAEAGARLFRDVLDGGPGADVLAGGDGDFDAADYSSRSAPVSVTLDGVANDGEVGENDFVAADVEDARGGSGDDVLVGNRGANTLRGGAGDDTIDGRGGYQDDTVAGSGDDVVLFRDGGIEARQGVQGALPGFAFDDYVTCNGGRDTAFVDPTDVGEAGQVGPHDVPCEVVLMTTSPQPLPVRGGQVTLPVACGAGPAELACIGVARVRVPRARGAASRVPPVAGRTVARHRFRQRLGPARRVKVRLNTSGRRAARGKRRLRAWVTYTYRR